MKRVLLVTDGIFHPPLLARWRLRRALEEMAGFSFQHLRSLEKLPSDLVGFSALVLYFHHREISRGALSRLEAFCSGGGGLLGVHSATASFKGQPGYHRILGGRFTGHGKVEAFQMRPVGGSEPFGGIPALTVRDELYWHQLAPGVQPHFTAQDEEREHAAVWTYHYGRGRVCVTVPGHRAATLRHPTYRQILQRGLSWVCEP